MIKKIYIFDIDGVLLDSSHRYRVKSDGKIDLNHWRTNCVESEIMKDAELPMASIYKKLLHKPSTYVIIATARQMTRHDFKSIENTIGMPNHFIYRKKDDNQSGTSLKLKGIKKLLNLKQFSGKMVTLFEDNIDYLYGLTSKLNCEPVYIHSKQGF